MSGLAGRVALITGGSRGNGKATSLALAKAGAGVAVNYRERVNKADAVVNEVRDHNVRAEAFRCDVSLGASMREMVRSIEKRLGPIDVLVDNAGIAASQTTEEDFDRTIAFQPEIRLPLHRGGFVGYAGQRFRTDHPSLRNGSACRFAQRCVWSSQGRPGRHGAQLCS